LCFLTLWTIPCIQYIHEVFIKQAFAMELFEVLVAGLHGRRTTN
jgi:hypothetical protein